MTTGFKELAAALAEARSVTHEQFQAAWQIHVDRVQEQLQAGWQEQIAGVVEQRFTELAPLLEASCRDAVRDEVARQAGAQVREVTGSLNQAVRRLRNAAGKAELVRALIDAAAGFCRRAALFQVNGSALQFEAAGGWYDEAPFGSLKSASLELKLAPALAAAVEGRDVVVAAATPDQVSERVAAFFEGAAKIYLFPLVMRDDAPGNAGTGEDGGSLAEQAGPPAGRVAAILCASAGMAGIDAGALELLSAMACSTLELREQKAKAASAAVGLIPVIQPAAAASGGVTGVEERALAQTRMQAEKFARTRTAEWMLFRFTAIKKGRSEANIYGTLKEEIDTGRNEFRERFLSANPALSDYLHVELVRTVAGGDAALLGPEYPGPLR